MTNYSRGRAKEYAFMKALRDDGYTTLRTAGSHGDFDVIAYKHDGPVHLYQLKYTEKGTVTKNELTRFDTAPVPEGAAAYLISYKKGHTTAARIFFRTSRTARRTVFRDRDDSGGVQSQPTNA